MVKKSIQGVCLLHFDDMAASPLKMLLHVDPCIGAILRIRAVPTPVRFAPSVPTALFF